MNKTRDHTKKNHQYIKNEIPKLRIRINMRHNLPGWNASALRIMFDQPFEVWRHSMLSKRTTKRNQRSGRKQLNCVGLKQMNLFINYFRFARAQIVLYRQYFLSMCSPIN